MTPAKDDGPSFLDERHQRLVEFADEFVDEEEREEFVDGMLEKHGYVRTSSWAPPAPDPKNPPKSGNRPGFYPRKS